MITKQFVEKCVSTERVKSAFLSLNNTSNENKRSGIRN